MGSDSENYFQEINTIDKAYWLGFIYADGCIAKNSLKFCLSLKDEERLHQFISDTNGDIKLHYYTRKLNYKNEIREYKCCDASWLSKKLIQDLKKIGCGSAKTFRIRLPQLESSLLYDAFLLGFYDGDGFQRSHGICSGNKEFLEDIKIHYKIPYEVKLKIHINKIWSCYTLCIGWDLHSRIILAYDKSMPRKRNFKSREQVNQEHSLRIKNSIERRKLDGVWINPFSGKQIKIVTLSDLGITVDKFKELCKLNGLAKVAKMYNKGEKIIRRLCKENGIHYSCDDRGQQQKKFEVTFDELQQMVNEMPMIKIGKKFGVSDNAVKKRCKKLGVIVPQKRIWSSSLTELEKGRNIQRELQMNKSA